MKIALFTDGIAPLIIGGMQKHSFFLAKYLAQNKIFVDVYHPDISDKMAMSALFTDDELEYLKFYFVHFPKKVRIPGHYLRESFEYSDSMFKLFEKQSDGVDFVYAKGFTGWKLLQEKKNGNVSIPVGVNFHGFEMFQRAPDLKSYIQQILLLRRAVRFSVLNSDYVFSYGGKISKIINRLINDKSKIIEVPSGVDKDWLSDLPFCARNKKIKFVFIGRNERRKGIEELNLAINQLLKDGLEFEFHFVGPIPGNSRINAEPIKYWGPISESSQIKKIISCTDVLVCPSHSEGMPNVVLEGMASGLAIIATDVGAMDQMVSSTNGWLIEKPDPDELTNVMRTAILFPEDELNKMKLSSIEKIKNGLLWEDIIKLTITKITNSLIKY